MATKITPQRVTSTLSNLKTRLDKENLHTVYGRYRSYAVGNAMVRWESKYGVFLANSVMASQEVVVADLEDFLFEMKESSRTWSSRGAADGYGMVVRSLTRLLEKSQSK